MPYHHGELEAQARAGQFDEAVQIAGAIRPVVPPPLARFLLGLPWILLGGADAAGAVWATALAGAAGFVRATDERTVRIDALPGPDDPLAGLGLASPARGAGEAGVGPPGPAPAALLALDPGRRLRARVNGRVARDADGLSLTTEQVYANCTKYIQKRHLAADSGAAAVRRPPARVTEGLADDDLRLLSETDTFFVATVATDQGPGHGADLSHRGGHPGFLEALDPRTLRFADYAGNSMFNTLGNLEVDPRAGLLVPDFATGDLLHLTGRAEVDYDPEPLWHHPGAQRIVRVAVDRAVRRPAALPLRSDGVEYSPFLPPRPVAGP